MAGFNLLRSVTLEPANLAILLRHAINHADASDARCWLDTLAPKIGPKRLAAILAEAARQNPNKVSNWVYWRFAVLGGKRTLRKCKRFGMPWYPVDHVNKSPSPS